MSEQDIFRVVHRQPPHRLRCHVGLLRPATLRDKFIRDAVQEYDFYEEQRHWRRYASVSGIVLNNEIRPTRYAPGNRGLLLLVEDDTVKYALGGLTTGWQAASNILQDPSDIVIPQAHLKEYSPSGDQESFQLRERCMHPFEIDEALVVLRTLGGNP